MASPVSGQRPVDTRAFFGNATGAVGPGTPVASGTDRMPWIEKTEFRTETNDFDPEEQEFTLRLTPSFPGLRRSQSALYQHLEARPDFAANEEKCDALADRYAAWVELYFVGRERALLAELEVLRNDRLTVLGRLVGGLDFVWKDLISARREATDLAARKLQLSTRETRLTTSYGIGEAILSFADFMSLEELGGRLGPQLVAITDPELSYEIETANRELDLERAERRRPLDFAQFRYRGPHNEDFRDRFSVGLGFQLENTGSQRLKIRELELEREELNARVQAEQAEEAMNYDRHYRNLRTSLAAYYQLQRLYTTEAEELAEIGNQLRRAEGFDPLPLLEIQEREMNNHLRLLTREYVLYTDYLRLMETGGALCEASRGELLLTPR